MEISAQRHIHVICKRRTWGTKPVYNKHIIGERRGGICREVVARGAPRTERRPLGAGEGETGGERERMRPKEAKPTQLHRGLLPP